MHPLRRLFILNHKITPVSTSLEPRFVTSRIEGLRERTKHLDIFLFLPITQWCSISDVLFAGGKEVSDFSVLKYY